MAPSSTLGGWNGFGNYADTAQVPELCNCDLGGVKYDSAKPRLDLIPTSAYRAMGAVLTYGAEKYKPNGWKSVERERYVAALLRHLVAYMDSPTGVDEESGLPHIAHVLTNAVFLNHFAEEGNA